MTVVVGRLMADGWVALSYCILKLTPHWSLVTQSIGLAGGHGQVAGQDAGPPECPSRRVIDWAAERRDDAATVAELGGDVGSRRHRAADDLDIAGDGQRAPGGQREVTAEGGGLGEADPASGDGAHWSRVDGHRDQGGFAEPAQDMVSLVAPGLVLAPP